MKKIIIQNQLHRFEITNIALGDINLINNSNTRQEGYRIIDSYIEHGGNVLDCARLYGDGESEVQLGKYFKQNNKRKDVFICTKGAFQDATRNERRVNQKDILHDLELSLTALEMEYVDIYMLHRDDIHTPVEEIMPVMDKIVKSGKARTVAASNWTAGRIARANAFAVENGLTPFSTSQIYYSLALGTPAITGDTTHVCMNDNEMPWYKESKLPLMTWCSNARAYFTQVLSNQLTPNTTAWFDWCDENRQRAYRLQALSNTRKKPITSLVIAYLLNQSIDVCSVVSCVTTEQLDEIMLAGEITLSPSEISFLERG